jgi:spermidine/putrescine-binding protein
MKKFSVIIALIALVALVSLSGCGKKQATLYIFNWSDYIDTDLLRNLKKNTTVRSNTVPSIQTKIC